MENNGQSGRVFAIASFLVPALLVPSSFLSSHHKGSLTVIVVVVGRISLNAEAG